MGVGCAAAFAAGSVAVSGVLASDFGCAGSRVVGRGRTGGGVGVVGSSPTGSSCRRLRREHRLHHPRRHGGDLQRRPRLLSLRPRRRAGGRQGYQRREGESGCQLLHGVLSFTRPGRLCLGKHQPESRAVPGRRLHFDLSVMQLDDAVDHREADAAAFFLVVKYRSKIRAEISGGMPTPVSSTSIVDAPRDRPRGS